MRVEREGSTIEHAVHLCADGSYYVGSTRDLEHRIWQHNNDVEGPLYTRRRRPVRLVWAAEFEHVGAAFAFEKQVQGWSRRKRQALIDGEWDRLPALASRAWRFRRPDSPRWFRDVR